MKTINNSNTIDELVDALKAIKKCIVFSHYNPDGDAIGSAMALTLALKNAGKEVNCYIKFDDGEKTLPWKFLYLPNIEDIENSNIKKIDLGDNKTVVYGKNVDNDGCDTIVAIDCANTERLGDCQSLFDEFRDRKKGVTINIDHHDSNTKFGRINFVTEEPATCQMLPEIFDKCEFKITREIAEYLVCGILTDTGNLSHSDVTADSYKIMARLKEIGANTYFANQELLVKQPKARALLYGRVTSKIRFFEPDENGKEQIGIVITTVEDLKECKAKQEHTSGIVDFPLTVDGVKVSASIMEQEGKNGQRNFYRISLRSKDGVDVNKVAGEFGGGGHTAASGCKLYCELEEVVERLVCAIKRYL